MLGKKENELVLVFESFGFKYGIPRMRTSGSTPVSCPTRTGSRSSSPSPARMSPWPTTFQPAGCHAVHPADREYAGDLVVPHLERNNRSYVTVGIGCTGGQHRSVFIAERLASAFRLFGKNVQIRHYRTLDKRSNPAR